MKLIVDQSLGLTAWERECLDEAYMLESEDQIIAAVGMNNYKNIMSKIPKDEKDKFLLSIPRAATKKDLQENYHMNLLKDFQINGEEAVTRVRNRHPVDYLKLVKDSATEKKPDLNVMGNNIQVNDFSNNLFEAKKVNNIIEEARKQGRVYTVTHKDHSNET